MAMQYIQRTLSVFPCSEEKPVPNRSYIGGGLLPLNVATMHYLSIGAPYEYFITVITQVERWCGIVS